MHHRAKFHPKTVKHLQGYCNLTAFKMADSALLTIVRVYKLYLFT